MTAAPGDGAIDPDLLSPANRAWLNAFLAATGRAPRVLHIGNIANNAYNNATLLNRAGLDCDVISYDYCHVMACPEWEDADFCADALDAFAPDWTSVDLQGFARPRWFAQGPLTLCLEYLIARNTGDHQLAAGLWGPLGLLGDASGTVVGESWTSRLRRIRRWLTTLVLAPDLLTKLDWRLRFLQRSLVPLGSLIALAIATGFIAVAAAVRLLACPWVLLWGPDRRFDRRVQGLVRRFARAFEQRQDKLCSDDLECYRGTIVGWRELFPLYDVIIGYSTDPILPLLASKNYFAFEHGTLREIPFVVDAQGRRTALAYHCAQHVFVTNTDCLDNARRLADGRATLINHPYDEDHGIHVDGWQELRKELGQALDADFIFFFPTRHDWVPGSGYADKANDVFLRAFASLRHAGLRVGMVCCRWGANQPESIALLRQLGCEPFVKWTQPLAMVRFERTAKACHCVVDQFKLGSFGGLVFKAMAVGAPVCTFLNEAVVSRHYSVMPPVINCGDEDEIVHHMSALIGDADRLRSIGEASRHWMKEHHSAAAVVNAQVDRFRLAWQPATTDR